MALSNEQWETLERLLSTGDPKKMSQARVLAEKFGVRDDPEYVELVEEGLQAFIDNDANTKPIDKILRKDGDGDFYDLDIDKRKEVTLYFDHYPNDFEINHADTYLRYIIPDLSKPIGSYLYKTLGVKAKVSGKVEWELDNDHDMDGYTPIPGNEWISIRFEMSFPFSELL